MRRTGLTRRSLLASAGAASVSPVLFGSAPGDVGAAPAAGGDPEVHTEPAYEGHVRTGAQQRSGMAPGHYWAPILGGELTGALLAGAVQSGRIDWSIDAASQTMQIAAQYAVLRADGVLVQIKDRSVHPQAIRPIATARLQTAPELVCEGATGQEFACLLVGLLDVSQFASGQVKLRAFRVV